MMQDNFQNIENDKEITDTKEEKKILDKTTILGLIDKKIEVVCDDQLLRQSDIASMKLHNEEFDSLLKSYVKNSSKCLEEKFWFKLVFFAIAIIILVAFGIVNISVIFFVLTHDMDNIEMISVLLTNIVSTLTTFIVLPEIIAKYLFDTKEESNMLDIVKNIQEHDKEIRNGLKNDIK